jgi:hypothetical protein
MGVYLEIYSYVRIKDKLAQRILLPLATQPHQIQRLRGQSRLYPDRR